MRVTVNCTIVSFVVGCGGGSEAKLPTSSPAVLANPPSLPSLNCGVQIGANPAAIPPRVRATLSAPDSRLREVATLPCQTRLP